MGQNLALELKAVSQPVFDESDLASLGRNPRSVLTLHLAGFPLPRVGGWGMDLHIFAQDFFLRLVRVLLIDIIVFFGFSE